MFNILTVVNDNIRSILKYKDNAFGVLRNGEKKVPRNYFQDKAEEVSSGFSRSSLSKIDSGQNLNFSVDKIEALCAAFEDGIEPWQLLHPSGFDEDGKSLASSASLSLPRLTEATIKAIDIAKTSEIENAEFIARVTALIYEHEATRSEDDIAMQILKISRDY